MAADAPKRAVRTRRAATSSRTTIDDVARAAQVSRQTVSNVVRGRGRVGAETGQRVREAIDALEYHPHRGARSMRSRRSWQIALLLGPSPPSGGYLPGGLLVRALIAATAEQQHHLLLGSISPDSRSDIEELIRSGSVDGFIVADLAPEDPRVELLAGRGVPFAAYGRTEPDLPQSWVDLDMRGAAQTATEHLIRSGHRRLAFVGHADQTRWQRDLETGYRAAITDAKRTDPVLPMPQDLATMARAMDTILRRRRAPTGIVAGGDAIAAAAYLSAARQGRTVGSDLAIVGIGRSALTESLTPTLTSATFSAERLAERLVSRVLVDLTAHPPRAGELVGAELQDGASA